MHIINMEPMGYHRWQQQPIVKSVQECLLIISGRLVQDSICCVYLQPLTISIVALASESFRCEIHTSYVWMCVSHSSLLIIRQDVVELYSVSVS